MSMKPQQKNVVRPCPICGNTVGEVLHHLEFSLPTGHCLPASYDVVACHRCGIAYADTPALQVDYDRYYLAFSKYENTGLSTGGGATELDARRIERTAADIARLLPDKKASILDIGCANGGLLAVLRRAGYANVIGVDPSPACVDQVKKQGMQACVGGLLTAEAPDAVLAGERHDCIILSHVLEHVRSLREAVSSVVASLKPLGLVYVEVPDASRYDTHPIVPFYYFDCEHINHFDEQVLRNLFLQFDSEFVTAAKKELTVAGGKNYPAVYAVFRRIPGRKPEPVMQFHDSVHRSVREHIRQSIASGDYRAFEELARSQEPLVIWGAGSHALRLLKSTALSRCNIVGFVDRDAKKHGKQLGGVTVHDPSFLLRFAGTVVVCAALHNDDIIKELRSMGITSDVLSAR